MHKVRCNMQKYDVICIKYDVICIKYDVICIKYDVICIKFEDVLNTYMAICTISEHN